MNVGDELEKPLGAYVLQADARRMAELEHHLVVTSSPPLLGPRPIRIEAEVKHCFFAVADDNFDDHAKVYRFRLWGWDLVKGLAQPRVIFGLAGVHHGLLPWRG